MKNNFIKKAKTQPLVLLILSLLMVFSMIWIFGACSGSVGFYTEKNNGDKLTLKMKDTIKIRLESNITTGYNWNLSENNNTEIISLISSEYTEKENNKNLEGKGGFETFYFKAESAGNTVLTLTYNRPWEKDVQPEKIFKLNIAVE